MHNLSHIPVVENPESIMLPIDAFKEMDRLAIEKYRLPIELMMENAGLQLARLVASIAVKGGSILIGTGKGNNGGGGVVAARRLSGWGYNVFLDIPDKDLRPLPAKQLQRALSFGASQDHIPEPDIFVDAYLGFSQHLPLSEKYARAVSDANNLDGVKISLDLPTGFDARNGTALFHPDYILTMAAHKTELQNANLASEIFLADIGIPAQLYHKFGVEQPDFSRSGIIKL